MITFKQYLLEKKDTDANLEKIRDLIARDCKPFLSIGPKAVYRGLNLESSMLRKLSPGCYLGAVRNDRRSLDSSPQISASLNGFFNQRVGVPLRSASLFVTHDKSMAVGYGKSCGIFPIGEFHYAWSPYISDAFIVLHPDGDVGLVAT